MANKESPMDKQLPNHILPRRTQTSVQPSLGGQRQPAMMMPMMVPLRRRPTEQEVRSERNGRMMNKMNDMMGPKGRLKTTNFRSTINDMRNIGNSKRARVNTRNTAVKNVIKQRMPRL